MPRPKHREIIGSYKKARAEPEEALPLASITAKQDRLLFQLDGMLYLLGLDPDRLLHRSKGRDRTTALQRANEYLVRSAVVFYHVRVDDLLGVVLQAHVQNKNRVNNIAKRITEQLAERAGVNQKLEIIKEIMDVPADIEKCIRALTTTRNICAHRLIIDVEDGQVPYTSHDLLNLACFEVFLDDMHLVEEFFSPEVHWLFKFPGERQ